MTMHSCRQLAAKISFCSRWLHKTCSGFHFFLSGKNFRARKSRIPQIPCSVRSISQLLFVVDVLLWCFALEENFQPCVRRPRERSGGRTCSISAGTTASPRKCCSTAAWCGASSLGPPQTPKVEQTPPHPHPFRIYVLIKRRCASPRYDRNHKLIVSGMNTDPGLPFFFK